MDEDGVVVMWKQQTEQENADYGVHGEMKTRDKRERGYKRSTTAATNTTKTTTTNTTTTSTGTTTTTATTTAATTTTPTTTTITFISLLNRFYLTFGSLLRHV